jgi:metal-responsive CopG/Arc/MetJ family transcriptional regulator
MSDEEIAAIDAIADREAVTRSDVVRDAVRDYLRRAARRVTG